MNEVISALLSPAVGIAISPFPIVGLILILLSKKARVNSLFYSAGWIIGNGTVFVIAMLLMSQASHTSDPGFWAKMVAIVLGGLLILLAIKNFVGRPKKGEKAKTPKWFAKMSNIGPVGASIFGFILSALNPKNLLLALGAGAAVGQLDVATTENQIWGTVIFLAIACCSIVIPTLAFLIAGKRLNDVLDNMRKWLIQNNSVIMAILLLMIGLSIISKAF